MLGEVSRHDRGGPVRQADSGGAGLLDRVDETGPVGVVAEDKPVVGGLPAATAADAHPPADHRDAEALGPGETSDPRARRGGGWGDDDAAVLEILGGVLIGVDGGGEVDAVGFIDGGELGDRAVDADGPDGRIEQAEDALGLAQRVGEQDSRSARGGVGAPPVVDVAGDLRTVRPAVDGQGEGRLAEKGVARDGLEGLGRGILLSMRIDLVIARDAPCSQVGCARLGVLDADLSGSQDVPRGVECDAGLALGDGFAEMERGGVDGGADADFEQVTGRGAREVVVASGAGVIGVGVGDDGALDGAPRVYVEVAGGAPEATVGGHDQVASGVGCVGGRHGGLFA